MAASNYADVVRQLEAAGLELATAIGAGGWTDGVLLVGTDRPVRCKTTDDPRERRGWYRLHELALASGARLLVGSFGVWRGDDNQAAKVQLPKAERQQLDPDQQAAIRARQEADRRRADAERQAQADRAARRAAAWWAQCKDEGEPAYLQRKGLSSRHGARVSPDGNLVVPMLDAHRAVRGLQVIYSDPKVRERKGRDKDYAPPGVAKRGLMFVIGALTSSAGVVLVCEGFATGASLHEATGMPVVVAFDAGNLLPVAEALRRQFRRRLRLLFCADDDYLGTCAHCKQYTLVEPPGCAHCGEPHGKVNTGRLRAEAAAVAVDGAVCVPQFAGERPVNRKGATDFNDLHVMPAGGLQQVAAQVEASILAQGWQAQVNVARVAHARGAGNGGTPSLKPLLTVDEAAARYALCYASRGTLYDAQERVLVNKDDVRDLLPDHGWREWKTHPARRVVRMRDVGFDPTETDPTITCNLYSGWPTEPKAGQCDRLLSLLSYLCSGDGNAADVYEWVLRWLAYPIQHPGAKMRTALVMHGPQGAGKNLIFEAVMSIYGQYGRIIDQAAVEDKFNDWASRKLFLIADEVVARAELFHIKNKLKGLVTGDWIRINEKNVAAHDERNHVNLVFLSNEKQPLVLDEDDRRYVVIWTPAGISPQFYADVAQELAAGGAAALHHFLLELDLGDFGPHTKPPSTEARKDLIELGRDSVSIFVRDWLAGETPYPVMPALSSDFYEAYSRHCRKSGEPRPRTHNQFAGDIRKRPGWSLEPRHVFEDTVCYGATKPRRIVIPPVAALQAAGNEQPPGEPLSKWLTRSFFAFAKRLEGL